MNNEIKLLRERLGLTQDAFAFRLGVAPYTVRRWESGKTKPSRMARKLLGEISGQDEQVSAGGNPPPKGYPDEDEEWAYLRETREEALKKELLALRHLARRMRGKTITVEKLGFIKSKDL